MLNSERVLCGFNPLNTENNVYYIQLVPRSKHFPSQLWKQERQYTYNVTLRRVRETIIAVEKQYYNIMSVCL